MDHVPKDIYQNIIIVTVLNIEVVLDETVSSQALDEVCYRGLPI